MYTDPNSYNNYGGLFAMSVISLLPVILVFIKFQKYLVAGIATDGIKGNKIIGVVIDRLPTERCAAFKGSGSYGKRRACSAHPYNAFQEGNCYAFEPKHHLPRGCHHKTDPIRTGCAAPGF